MDRAKTCCSDDVMEESDEVTFSFSGIKFNMYESTYSDTTSRPTSSLKKERLKSCKKYAFQFENVSTIVEFPPAGHDSFCRAFELRHVPSGKNACVRRCGYNSVLLVMYASCVRQ